MRDVVAVSGNSLFFLQRFGCYCFSFLRFGNPTQARQGVKAFDPTVCVVDLSHSKTP